MKNLRSNKELILLIQKNDKIAFYNLYERYCKRLYGFVLRYIKQKEDAEEILQEVFVKIWESRRKIDANSSFESFLFTVAYNTTISMLRKKINETKYIKHLKSSQQVITTPDLMNEIDFNELNDRLQLLLNQLTPRQKEIFQLSRDEGLTNDEIAKKLNLSVNTVKKHISNTLAFLKYKIGTSLTYSLILAYLLFF